MIHNLEMDFSWHCNSNRMETICILIFLICFHGMRFMTVIKKIIVDKRGTGKSAQISSSFLNVDYKPKCSINGQPYRYNSLHFCTTDSYTITKLLYLWAFYSCFFFCLFENLMKSKLLVAFSYTHFTDWNLTSSFFAYSFSLNFRNKI